MQLFQKKNLALIQVLGLEPILDQEVRGTKSDPCQYESDLLATITWLDVGCSLQVVVF